MRYRVGGALCSDNTCSCPWTWKIRIWPANEKYYSLNGKYLFGRGCQSVSWLWLLIWLSAIANNALCKCFYVCRNAAIRFVWSQYRSVININQSRVVRFKVTLYLRRRFAAKINRERFITVLVLTDISTDQNYL